MSRNRNIDNDVNEAGHVRPRAEHEILSSSSAGVQGQAPLSRQPVPARKKWNQPLNKIVI